MLSIIPTIQSGLSSPVRYINGKVEHYRGSTLLNTFYKNTSLQEIEIQRVAENSRFFGMVICQRCHLKLRDVAREIDIQSGDTLIPYIGVSDQFIKYPRFTITEINRNETTNQLLITSWDDIDDLKNHKIEELNLTAPYTIADVVNAIAGSMNTTYRTVNFSGDTTLSLNYPEGANLDGTETVKEVLQAIAEATLSVIYVDDTNKLVLKRMLPNDNAVLTIGRNAYTALSSKTNKRLVGVAHITELGDNVERKLDVSGTVQQVANNPFWDMRTDIGSIVDNAVAVVGGLTINQFSCSWVGNLFLEIGDKIAITTKDDGTVYSYVLDDVIVYDGGLIERTQWDYAEEEAVPTNPTSIGDALKATYAKVDKVNKQITLHAEDIQEHSEKIAQLELSVGGISQSVSSTNTRIETLEGQIADIEIPDYSGEIDQLSDELAEYKRITEENIGALVVKDNEILGTVTRIQTEQTETIDGVVSDVNELRNSVETKVTADEVQIMINESQSDGVTAVDTGTGFTFNKDGLTIEKTGSEMKTNIDEDGMRVYRNDEEVLTADNQGVNAINLTARQYLMIGLNSRFEDYKEVRTACFYVGQGS